MSDIQDQLSAVLPAAAFREVTQNYLEEPRGTWHGQASAVVAPGSTEEVAEVLRRCFATATPVLPYGGGTGLVGGQISQEGPPPVILSLERMRQIGEVDVPAGTVTVQAGAVLADVHAAAAEAGLLFPLSLGSQGTARIGGLLGTNAGGVNVIRYGNTRDLCLGLEAVLPDGTIFHGLSGLRKDNTGYDLRHLMIGSEGTLGVITGAVLKLFPQPASTGAAMMALTSAQAAPELLSVAKRVASGDLSAFELISRVGLDFLTEVGLDVRFPFADPPEWMCLIDLGCGPGQLPDAILEAIFEEAFAAGLVSDGVIAQSEAQRGDFWALRETIPEGNRLIGSIASHDISLPISRIAEFIARGPDVVAEIGEFRINCFGHLGDGNLHWNVFPALGRDRKAHANEKPVIQEAVHDLVHAMGGSVSAEHGIGRLKVADLERYGDPGKLSAMRAIKAALDPKGIMNPGAVLRTQQ